MWPSYCDMLVAYVVRDQSGPSVALVFVVELVIIICFCSVTDIFGYYSGSMRRNYQLLRGWTI